MKKLILNTAAGFSAFLLLLLLPLFGLAATPVTKAEELKLATGMGAAHHVNRNAIEPFFIPEIQKRTGGRIKITFYPGQALGKAMEHYELTRTGVADIGMFSPSWTAGVFPFQSVFELPFWYTTSAKGSAVAQELAQKGWFDKESVGVKLLTVFLPTPYHIFGKKRVQTIEDIKGLKIRAVGYGAKYLVKVGAFTVPISPAELYLALQRGVVDGVSFSYASAKAFKMQEVCKCVTELYFGSPNLVFAMNKKVWNELPPDIQQVFLQVGKETSARIAESYDSEDKLGKEAFLKAGVEIMTLPPAEMERWKKVGYLLYDQWIKEIEDKGFRAGDFIKEFMSLIEKYGMKAPYKAETK